MPWVEHPNLLGPFSISAHEFCPRKLSVSSLLVWLLLLCLELALSPAFQLFLSRSTCSIILPTCSIILPTCVNLRTFLSSPILRCLLELLIQIILTRTYSRTASCLILQNSNSTLFSPANYQSRCSILAPLETWSAYLWAPTAASVDRKQNCVCVCVCGAWRIASIIDNLRCKVNMGLVATTAASGQQHLRWWNWEIRHTHWWLSW